ATRELYGGTLALIRQDLEPAGYEANFIDMTDLETVRRSISGAGLVLVETITNPLCRMPDVEVIASVARAHGWPLLVDNTFATPILFRPLEVGATAVMHSATKYIGGHSDLVAGVVVGDAGTMAAARARSVRTGATLGPFDAWLALRGLRTLDVRMRQHSYNGLALARALRGMPGVARVHHPLLEESPSYEVARRLLPDWAGGMLAFSGVVMFGVLVRSPSIAILGGGFLIGKAVLNILVPEGGTVYRRSLIGYALGGIYVLIGVAAAHFLTSSASYS